MSWSDALNFIADKEISVPLGEVALFTVLVSVCFFFCRHKMGLLISYGFVFHWGFVFNRGYFVTLFGDNTTGLYIYTLCGIATALLVLLGFFREER